MFGGRLLYVEVVGCVPSIILIYIAIVVESDLDIGWVEARVNDVKWHGSDACRGRLDDYQSLDVFALRCRRSGRGNAIRGVFL